MKPIWKLNVRWYQNLLPMEIMDDREWIEMTIKAPGKGFRSLMAKYKEMVYWHIRRTCGGKHRAAIGLQCAARPS